MKLLRIEASKAKNKRYVAIFDNNGKSKKTNFGLKNPKKGTFTDTGNIESRSAYRARHKKDLKTKDPTRAGYLSYYLLWGNSKSLKVNLTNYKKRFNL